MNVDAGEQSDELRVEPGDVLAGKYRVEAIIGSGGMGVVVAANHVAMNNRVAIKLLRLHEEKNPKDAIARFVREARAAARIQNDHVVRVTDVASLPDGTPYMVMEYLDGFDLRRVVQDRGPLPIEEAIGYVLQACEGLAEAHGAGVVHRDLKPSNLFLARRPNGPSIIKVLDFGISKVAPRSGEVAITTTSSLMGSPLYMAPEQMRSSKDVDARADVWSLGLILYELIAGTPPFIGETIPEICVAVMSGEPTAISKFRSDVPQDLQAILLKCLAKERGARFPSMGALARELERFAGEHARVHAARASAAVKSAARSGALTLPESVIIDDREKDATRDDGTTLPRDEPDSVPSWSGGRRVGGARRRTVLWLGLAVLVTGTLASVGAFVAHGPGEGSSASPATSHAPSAAPPSSTALTPTIEVASVPFDTLPVAAHDAGPSTVRAKPTQPRTTPTTASPTTSATAPKDDWKWGDRN